MGKTKNSAFIVLISSFLLFFLASCSKPGPEPLLQVQIGNPIGLCHAGQTKTEREYVLLDDIGCQWLRVDYHWNSIEKVPGEYDFTAMDHFTNTALEHNKSIIAVLCYDAAWIHEDNKTHSYVPPGHYDSYISFVAETVRHYKGKVAAFEIWNEPNLVTDRFWKGTDDEFINLFYKTVKAIKETDPDIIITTPGLCLGDEKYLQKIFQSGAMKYVDVISFHPYSITLSGYMKQIERIQNKAKEYDYKGDFWISEMGYPTGGLYPTRVSEKNYPDRIVKALVCGLAKDIKLITWYHLFDPVNRRWSNSEDFFGLATGENEYRYKNGMYAFRAVARNIPESRLMNSRIKCNDNGVIYYNFEHDNGECLLVLWSNRGRHKVNISFPSAGFSQWDISSPDVQSFASASEDFSIGKRPVVLTYNNDLKKQGSVTIYKK